MGIQSYDSLQRDLLSRINAVATVRAQSIKRIQQLLNQLGMDLNAAESSLKIGICMTSGEFRESAIQILRFDTNGCCDFAIGIEFETGEHSGPVTYPIEVRFKNLFNNVSTRQVRELVSGNYLPPAPDNDTFTAQVSDQLYEHINRWE